MTEVFGSGARVLLDYLQAQAREEETEELWETLWADLAFAAWVTAYEMLPGFEENLRALLREPTQVPNAEPTAFWEGFAAGFARARDPEVNAECRRALAAVERVDFAAGERTALRYLPPETPLEVEIYLTVDGCNGGMFRGSRAFLSVLLVSPDEVSAMVKGFAHEFHHIGAAHWFAQNPLLQRARERDAGKLAVEILEYLVSEGLANAFCSPSVLRLHEGDSKEAGVHNRRVCELEARWPDEAIERIEHLLHGALADPGAEELSALEESFHQFSLDLSGAGLPEGHFAAGRMVQRMAGALPLERIISLVQEPWRFLACYNEAMESKEPRFSKRLLEQIERAFEGGIRKDASSVGW